MNNSKKKNIEFLENKHLSLKKIFVGHRFVFEFFTFLSLLWIFVGEKKEIYFLVKSNNDNFINKFGGSILILFLLLFILKLVLSMCKSIFFF